MDVDPGALPVYDLLSKTNKDADVCKTHYEHTIDPYSYFQNKPEYEKIYTFGTDTSVEFSFVQKIYGEKKAPYFHFRDLKKFEAILSYYLFEDAYAYASTIKGYEWDKHRYRNVFAAAYTAEKFAWIDIFSNLRYHCLIKDLLDKDYSPITADSYDVGTTYDKYVSDLINLHGTWLTSIGLYNE